jgi:hypothetical protein
VDFTIIQSFEFYKLVELVMLKVGTSQLKTRQHWGRFTKVSGTISNVKTAQDSDLLRDKTDTALVTWVNPAFSASKLAVSHRKPT